MVSFLEVVAPVHSAISNASIEVMINCMFAQSVGNWSLSVVSDGPSDRVRSIVEKYDGVRYMEMSNAENDYGHTPRRVGLEASNGEWTLLTGIDNYYVPLMVETVAEYAALDQEVAVLAFDFLLDMKGEREAGEEYDRAMREYVPKPGSDLVVTPMFNGRIEEIRFGRDDDYLRVALDFVRRRKIEKGAGCDDIECIARVLVNAMTMAANGNDSEMVFRADRPYSGHVEVDLDRSGYVDIGAVVVRTDLARSVGYGWKHQSADFSYVQACLSEAKRRGMKSEIIRQTLYVHN